jgi:hypothetical protein
VGPFHDPNNFTEVFLGAFRRDVLSFYPGSRIEREAVLPLVDHPFQSARQGPTFSLDFQLHEEDGSADVVSVSLFGVRYRLSVPRPLGLGPRDRDLVRAIGLVMELHHQVLFRWSRVSLLQLRRGMPEDHYVAACLEPSAYAAAASAPSRIAEAILTLRTMALSTYENRRVTTGVLILGLFSGNPRGASASLRATSPEALTFGVELTGLKTLHRLCDGRRTLFLVDRQGKLSEIVDIRNWAINESLLHNRSRDGEAARESEVSWQGEAPNEPSSSSPSLTDEAFNEAQPVPEPVLRVPCGRAYMFHALATRTGGHVCLVLSPNQEIKVFAGGVQAFVFAHGRWRVLDPETKYGLWEHAVGCNQLARVLFQTALDLAEERQGGLLVVVSDPSGAIGRLIACHDVLEQEGERERETDRSLGDNDELSDAESPARPFTLFGLSTPPEPVPPRLAGQRVPSLATAAPEPLTKQSVHYLARGLSVTELDTAVLEALAGLDGALVTDREGRLLALGAILRHDAHSLPDPDPTATGSGPAPLPEGARTTAALVASRFGPVLKISEDGIVSCFLDGARVWDL